MEQTILDGYPEPEKAAYLGAIATIATADRSATPQELEYIDALCESAQLSGSQTEKIHQVATNTVADEELYGFLDTLKSSELRFSLVSDLIAFAQSDNDYSEDEKQEVKKVADYLGLSQEQYSVLNQFTRKAVEEAPTAEPQSVANSPHGFLDNLGLGDKLKNAGINSSSLVKSALGIIGPMLLAKIFSGRGRSNSGGGGGLLGNLGGMLGGGSGNSGGLLGNLGGLLSGGGLLGGLLGGGKGFGNAGNMLSRVLGR